MPTEKPTYLLNEPAYIHDKYHERGEHVTTDLPPGPHMEPVNDAAREAIQKAGKKAHRNINPVEDIPVKSQEDDDSNDPDTSEDVPFEERGRARKTPTEKDSDGKFTPEPKGTPGSATDKAMVKKAKELGSAKSKTVKGPATAPITGGLDDGEPDDTIPGESALD